VRPPFLFLVPGMLVAWSVMAAVPAGVELAEGNLLEGLALVGLALVFGQAAFLILKRRFEERIWR
jgi:hypothetical protein